MSVPQGKHTTGFVDPGLLALPTWYNEERRISGLIVALRNFAPSIRLIETSVGE